MDQCLELVPGVGIFEHNRREGAAVQHPFTGQHACTEPVDNRVEHRLPGLLEFMDDAVGFDHGRAASRQQFADGAFTGPDSAGQTDCGHARKAADLGVGLFVAFSRWLSSVFGLWLLRLCSRQRGLGLIVRLVGLRLQRLRGQAGDGEVLGHGG